MNGVEKWFRRVIKIQASDSPNVRVNLERVRDGLPPIGQVMPGVLSYDEYLKRRATWDVVRQCVGLDGEFYEGAEVLMFPPAWLDRAERLASGEVVGYRDGKPSRPPSANQRKAKGVGIDPGEGGDDTAYCAVDEWGVLDLVARSTPDTNVIYGEAISFCSKWGCPWERVVIDRGGGGKQLADRLRANGKRVQTVAFGEPVTLELKRFKTMFSERVEVGEERYQAKNRRAEMYLDLRELLDPASGSDGTGSTFGISGQYAELRRQLAPIPLLYDGEGRTYLPPKNKRTPSDTGPTLREMLGCSPDEADALVMAVRGMSRKPSRPTAGALG